MSVAMFSHGCESVFECLPSDCSVWCVCWVVQSRAFKRSASILFVLMSKLTFLFALLDLVVLTLGT